MRKRTVPKKLSKKLKQIRLELGLSQREIVKALNFTDAPLRGSQISMYENDLREPPITLVLAYAKLANLSTDVLIDDKWSVADVKKLVGNQTVKPPKTKGEPRKS